MGHGGARKTVPWTINHKGFTFIEIMVVIVILGILIAIVGPKFLGQTQEAKRIATAAQIRELEKGLIMFHLHNGFYPSTDQGLHALIKKPTSGRIPEKWNKGGYLTKVQIPVDSWGNEYIYLSPGREERDYDLLSYGSDGEAGGKDENADIKSWTWE